MVIIIDPLYLPGRALVERMYLAKRCFEGCVNKTIVTPRVAAAAGRRYVYVQTCQGWERKMRENSGVEARRVESGGGSWSGGGGKQAPTHQLVGLGERCKLPQRVCLGRSPSRNWLWCILAFLTSGGNNFNDIRDNQLTKFRGVYTLSIIDYIILWQFERHTMVHTACRIWIVDKNHA